MTPEQCERGRIELDPDDELDRRRDRLTDGARSSIVIFLCECGDSLLAHAPGLGCMRCDCDDFRRIEA